jgi:hypothetical protein
MIGAVKRKTSKQVTGQYPNKYRDFSKNSRFINKTDRSLACNKNVTKRGLLTGQSTRI